MLLNFWTTELQCSIALTDIHKSHWQLKIYLENWTNWRIKDQPMNKVEQNMKLSCYCHAFIYLSFCKRLVRFKRLKQTFELPLFSIFTHIFSLLLFTRFWLANVWNSPLTSLFWRPRVKQFCDANVCPLKINFANVCIHWRKISVLQTFTTVFDNP